MMSRAVRLIPIEKEKTNSTVSSITAAYTVKFAVVPEVYIMNTSDGTYEIMSA